MNELTGRKPGTTYIIMKYTDPPEKTFLGRKIIDMEVDMFNAKAVLKRLEYLTTLAACLSLASILIASFALVALSH